MTTTEPVLGSMPTGPVPASTNQGSDRSPWLLYVFCVVIAAMPTYVVLPGALKGNGAPARIISLTMFGLMILGFLLVRRNSRGRTINPGIVIMLLYFTLWLVTYGVGLLNIDDFVVSSNRTRAVVGLVAHVGVALYTITHVRTQRQRHIVMGCLAVGLTYACFVGLSQGVTSLDLRFLTQPPGFVINMDNLGFAERLGVRRVTGTSQHPIEFSVLAAVTVPLTVYFARNAETRRVRVMAGIGCVIALLALPAAVSRSGIISLIAALLVVMFAFRVRAIANAVVGAALAIGIYIVIFPRVANALWNTITNSAEDDSVEGRIDDYARVSESFREHPVFGLGLGGSTPSAVGYLDNEWLQAIVQGGVIGLTCMLLLSGGAIFGIAAALRGASDRREREQAFTLGAIVVGILASSATFDLIGFEQTTMLLFTVFGLLWSGYNIAVPGAKNQVEQHIR